MATLEKRPFTTRAVIVAKDRFVARELSPMSRSFACAVGMDTDRLHAKLSRCLLTDAEIELGPLTWKELEDPIPAWPELVGSESEK
jgi:hypothetical protein